MHLWGMIAFEGRFVWGSHGDLFYLAFTLPRVFWVRILRAFSVFSAFSPPKHGLHQTGRHHLGDHLLVFTSHRGWPKPFLMTTFLFAGGREAQEGREDRLIGSISTRGARDLSGNLVAPLSALPPSAVILHLPHLCISRYHGHGGGVAFGGNSSHSDLSATAVLELGLCEHHRIFWNRGRNHPIIIGSNISATLAIFSTTPRLPKLPSLLISHTNSLITASGWLFFP